MCNTKNEVCQIQNSLFVQYILITIEITVLLLQEMVISCKLCTNNSQSKCQNIKVSYKSAFQVQWMQNIYMTEWFKFCMTPRWLPAWAESNGTLQRNKRSIGHSPGEPGTEFCNYSISPRQTETVFGLHDPKSKRIYSLIAKKKICRDNTRKKNIPVISRRQWAVNINNRNVQVESVGWRFPHALRATWELSCLCSRANQRN